MSEDDDTLRELIEAYNRAVEDQKQLLTVIYHVFKQRPGYKRLLFGASYVWSNLNIEARLELPRLLADLIHPITGIE